MKTIKNITVKVLIVFLLVGTATAAVYSMANAEGRILFGLSPNEPSGTPITTLVGIGNDLNNTYDFGDLTEIQEFTIRQRNAEDVNYTSTLYFVIVCDEGLTDGYKDSFELPATRGIEDFDSMVYTNFNGIQHECNTVWMMERISPTTVKVTPPMEEFTFVPGYVYYTTLNVTFNPLAYGNYTIEVHVV